MMKVKAVRTFGLALPEFVRPKFTDTLHFPDDITSLGAQNVSELLGKYTKLLAYVMQEHTNYAMRVLKLESDMERLSSEIFLETPSIAHIERWKRDQKIKADGRMFNLRIKLVEAKQFKEKAYMFTQVYERFISALSRELSRKTAMGDNAARLSRLANGS